MIHLLLILLVHLLVLYFFLFKRGSAFANYLPTQVHSPQRPETSSISTFESSSLKGNQIGFLFFLNSVHLFMQMVSVISIIDGHYLYSLNQWCVKINHALHSAPIHQGGYDRIQFDLIFMIFGPNQGGRNANRYNLSPKIFLDLTGHCGVS